MSTKTTYKRIALVAVAALGFGLLSVAPSSATVQAGDTLTISATGGASTTTIGVAATTTLTQTFLGTGGDTMTVTASMVSYPSGNVAVPVLSQTALNENGNTLTTTAQVGTLMDTTPTGTYSTAKGVWTASFTPAAVGTYVIKFTPQVTANTAQTTAAAVTWTVTVAAIPTSSAVTSKSILAAGVTSAGSADVVVNVAKATSSAAAATIYVTPLTSTGSSITVPEALTVDVTGPGTAGIGASAGATSVGKSFTSGSAGWYTVSVWADGTAGVSTITIKSGTVTLGTETVTFIGDAASAVATVVTPVITSGSGATPIAAVTAIVKDSGGNVVSGQLLYAVSGTTTVFASTSATSDSVGKATFSFTGLVAGTSTVTIQDVAAGSTAGFSAPAVSLRAGVKTASSVTMTLDKATYVPGEAAVLTVVIKDAAGNTVPDGSYAVFAAALASSRALTVSTAIPTTTSLSTGSSTGTLTYAFNVPATTGDFTISADGATGLAAAQAGLAISAMGTVGLSAESQAAADAVAAAADAAAEATDAANAATDAANAAAEAADAATAAAQDAADAVAALSVQVGELVAGLTAQIDAQKAAIRALTNLVIKVQKAVAAAAKKK